MKNKNHWYDGMFYDKVIAPNQDKAFETVKEIISNDSVILDVGCGTGRMAFRLWDKYRKYTGIDLSIRNIDTAKKKLCKLLSEKIEYIHADAYTYLKGSDIKYDYAVLSYVIHEINESDRVPLLKLLSKHAENIIIVDYLVPRPGGFTDKINGIVEFVAGREHYRNFKSYVSKGGLRGLAHQSKLSITKEITDNPKTAHITVMKESS
ncbi:MAG: class I SAM-dependent methyltransferase [Candidatus Kapaibacterium sp.]